MDGRASSVDAYALHKRCTAASRGDGITLTDAPVRPFEDGRVTQVSLMEDSLHAVTQWGGAAATLGRIAATLSTGRIWGRHSIAKRSLTSVPTSDRHRRTS